MDSFKGKIKYSQKRWISIKTILFTKNRKQPLDWPSDGIIVNLKSHLIAQNAGHILILSPIITCWYNHMLISSKINHHLFCLQKDEWLHHELDYSTQSPSLSFKSLMITVICKFNDEHSLVLALTHMSINTHFFKVW